MAYFIWAILLWSLLPGSYALNTNIIRQQLPPSPSPSPTSTPIITSIPATSYSLSPISCSNITSCLGEAHLQIATVWGPLISPNNDTKLLKQIASSIDSLEAKWMSESEKSNSTKPGITQTSTTKACVPSCQNNADAENNRDWCVCSYSGSTRTFPTSHLPDPSGRPCPETAAASLFLATSSDGPKTITAGPKYPFTTTFDSGEVIGCETSRATVILGSTAWLCSGSKTTITPAPGPTVTLRLDGTPCNWGSAKPTDIYTSISSVLVEACDKSARQTVVTRSPNPIGSQTFTAYETTMSACNPTPMTIHGIPGLNSDEWPVQEVDGNVVVTADKNFFDETSLEMFINASVNAVVTSVQRNSVNMTIQNDLISEPGNYNVTYSSANSTELNYYEFGYTQYTQVFSVDYQWVGGKGHTSNGDLCQYARDVANIIVDEVPELADAAQFTTEICDSVYQALNG